ncbi:CarboxyPeptidase D family [Trichostrongylus colubriformis]|uniref:CarboxyPeptidase D family n=1 Tax=Trichostrongylus colubriformis TaxID=6319 RepID=A0AAN8F112_TRICO
MQDWQYTHTNSFEVTIEMGCFKFPTNDMLPKFWDENKFSLISLLEMAQKGVYGLVTDMNGKPAVNATIAVEEGKTIRATSAGEYWRMLPPGKHIMTVEAPGLELEMFEVEVGNELIRHDFKLQTCHDQDINQTIIMRGSGRIRMSVVGIGTSAEEVIRKLAHLVCSGEFELDPDIRLIMAPLLKPGNVEESIMNFNPMVVLAVSEGFVETVTFSPSQNQPRLFNKTGVDESLTKALGFGSDCDKPIRDAKVALAMDDLRLHSAFELGIALGCDNSTDLNKKAATVGTVLDMLKKTITLDTVQEYSVVPSANPTDHFTPDQTVMVTSASIPLLEEKQCLFTVSTKNRLLKLYRMGSGEPPYTLIMAVEKRTETLVYEMMSKWCDTPGAEGVQQILRKSTIFFMPEIPFTQLACHDYSTIAPFQPLLEHILKELPHIDYVVLFGSGGIKVRYIKASAGVADRLAKTYKLFHMQMSNADEDICPRNAPDQSHVIGEFEWNKTIPLSRSPDALLVQTGCCYEAGGSGHLYTENRESIVAMMNERLKGVRLIGDDVSLALRTDTGYDHPLEMSSKDYGAAFVGLPNGTHHVQVLKDGKLYAEFSVQITSTTPLVEKWIALHHSFWRNNTFVIAALVLLMMMACLFCCRQRVTSVLNRRGFFTGSREGFERIPLYKSDDEDEEDLFDLQKL